mmetsp:Transcript_18565/g.61188  ORF Transcript_18565/g.61188 Transcript_18565/m.61188 type:complete len:228 (+) Transcript_18565:124-807(+)
MRQSERREDLAQSRGEAVDRCRLRRGGYLDEDAVASHHAEAPQRAQHGAAELEVGQRVVRARPRQQDHVRHPREGEAERSHLAGDPVCEAASHLLHEGGRLDDAVLLVRGPDDEVARAVLPPHRHRAEEAPAERRDRREQRDRVVLEEAVDQVPDRVVRLARRAAPRPLCVAKLREEPLPRAARRQPLPALVVGGVRACPEQLELGALLVAQPPADAGARARDLVVD